MEYHMKVWIVLKKPKPQDKQPEDKQKTPQNTI